MALGGFDGLLGGVVRPGDGEVAGEQPHLLALVSQAAGEHVAGVVLAVVPVAEPVGDLTPVHRARRSVPAGPSSRLGSSAGSPGGDRVVDGPVGLAQDLADLFGPGLPVGVQGW